MAVSVQLRSGAHTTQPVRMTGFFVTVPVQLLRIYGTGIRITQPVQWLFLCMIYFVYILFSEKLNRFYIGTTDDPHRRLNEHNSIRYPNTYTSKGIPWSLFLVIA